MMLRVVSVRRLPQHKKKGGGGGGGGTQAYSGMHAFATQTLPPVDPAEQELNCAAPWY
jgi:hypothetical protein